MPLVNMRDMLYHAYENNYAVGAFDLVSLDFLEAVIDAAESCRSAVILSVAEPHFAHYDFELLLPAVEAAAKRASIPVAIQLDHGSSNDSVIKAINLGCNGVMLDASNQNFTDNIEVTRSVVEMAHRCGVAVVGELGYVAGKVGEGAKQHPGETAFTIPSEAKAYVERTQVDFLAVSIGTVQGRMDGRAKLDYTRLKQLNQAVNIPLVIHGGSGLNEDQFHKLTSNGVAKIDYFTALSDTAATAMRKGCKENSKGSFTDLKKNVKEAIFIEVQRCLRQWGSAGRAAEVLERCSPWLTVEHLIVHNVNSNSVDQLPAVIDEGKKILLNIPGVRNVFTGEAMQEKSKYRFCWLVNFTHEAALQNFREHQGFSDFLRKRISPLASDLLNVDYKENT
ncbi:Fructose-bisphosphate aldolase class II [hydrothermal vent metagenome]|uniref:Fructose-bisphosphate aldolase class II n=1 Tax=hydrothermal vent metagenome TaxID=652676 RepID=A0A3B0XEG6_9ZZZZ